MLIAYEPLQCRNRRRGHVFLLPQLDTYAKRRDACRIVVLIVSARHYELRHAGAHRLSTCADSSEVHDVFEVPLDRLLDISNYVISRRRAGPDWGHALREEIELETYSVRVAGRNIWGATAGILFNLARRCAPALQ